MYFSAVSIFASGTLAIAGLPALKSRSYLLASCGRAVLRDSAVIELVNFRLHFRRKTNSMQLVAALQTANDFAHLGDLTYAWIGVTVFNVNPTLRLGAFSGVVIVIGHIARAIF